ncbi:twin-arginine translocation signal domain-containing protein [Maribrevibacterium harenarium]|uniref:Twin-arginine translocation signal domain-containing protein n=1 Tax=Maribrevibacterium harenarium TaxID=2589817 RepID=A0A501WMC6_9GAMM|nr:twin-arginine translocation signal domain-containing protein [Maribrevibacterium harenarium]
MPAMTRRHFLTLSALAGGATATGGLLLSSSSHAGANPLLIPPLISKIVQ